MTIGPARDDLEAMRQLGAYRSPGQDGPTSGGNDSFGSGDLGRALAEVEWMRRSRDEWMGRHDSVRRQCADAEAQGDALRVELVAERDRAQRLYAYGQREEQLTLQARAESDKLRAAVASLTAAWDALRRLAGEYVESAPV